MGDLTEAERRELERYTTGVSLAPASEMIAVALDVRGLLRWHDRDGIDAYRITDAGLLALKGTDSDE